MLDDDCVLSGTVSGGREYIKQIEDHPDGFGIFKSLLLKLFAISKEVYKSIDFPDLEAANGDFFEDMYLILALSKKYPSKKFNFKRNNSLMEESNSSSDNLST